HAVGCRPRHVRPLPVGRISPRDSTSRTRIRPRARGRETPRPLGRDARRDPRERARLPARPPRAARAGRLPGGGRPAGGQRIHGSAAPPAAGHGARAPRLANPPAARTRAHACARRRLRARLDEPSRRLIERTSALSRFDAGLATRLAGQSQPHAALEALARRGLLRTFGAGEHVTYECHELVRRFVRQELETRLGADAWRALEAETADALAGRGEAERALRHYLIAGDGEEA